MEKSHGIAMEQSKEHLCWQTYKQELLHLISLVIISNWETTIISLQNTKAVLPLVYGKPMEPKLAHQW